MISSNVILTASALRDAVDYFLRQDSFAFDVETVPGTQGDRGTPKFNQVTWLAMATHGKTVVVPCGHPIGTSVIGHAKEPRADKTGKIRQFTVPIYEDPPEQLTPAEVFSILRPLFFSDLIKVCHEAPFDLGSVAKYFGEIPPGPYEDTKGIMRLLDENTASHDNGLKAWTKRLYKVDYDKENTGKHVEDFPFNKVARYVYQDAHYTWLIWLRSKPKIYEDDLGKVYDLVECPLTGPLTSMRLAGVHMDVPRLESTQKELTAALVGAEADVYRAAGQMFNINSPPQKVKILFGPKSEGGQGLKPWKFSEKTKEPSTDADVLGSFPTNELCRALLAHAEINKLLSTYVNSWLGVEGDAKKPSKIIDHYMYTEFQPHGTTSGRFSGRSPNLQNISRPDTKFGKLIRGVFDAPPGHKLIVADYGQIELVILAHLIGYGALFDGFHAGIDPHLMTAAGVLNRKPVLGEPGGVTSGERQQLGKTLNFTVVNGAGWKTTAEVGGFSERQAKKVLADYDKAFPEISKFRDAVLSIARDREPVPYVRSIMGRKRRLTGLLSRDYGTRGYWERVAFNFLIQGGAADLMKLAIARADYLLAEHCPEAWLTMTVHDELVAVAPDEYAEDCLRLIIESMIGEEMQKLIKVPLKVDAKIVQNWAEAK